MADVQVAPPAPHTMVPPGMEGEEEQQPRIQLNIDWGNVDLDSIVLPPGEDMGIKSDDEEEEEETIETDTGFGNVIIVDNLPVVASEKYEKLEGVIRKIFGQIGVITTNGLLMPRDESGKTKGYAFIEYSTPQEAQTAREQTNGYKLDRSHVFVVNMFDDYDKYMRVPDEWNSPEIKPYTPGENLVAWLTDDRGRDQFVIRFGSETEVYWNNASQGKPDPVYHRSFWTESFVQWSPLGTYLATIHRQGAAVWGGEKSFNRLMRYIHPQVKLIDFSPGEKFMVTYSSHEPSNPRDTQRVTLMVFDVRSGKVLREFKGSADDFATGGTGGIAGVSWPVFRWAGGRDDKYFARIGKNAISVYETDTMGLLDKKSLKVENVVDFCWSPTDPLLSLFVPEGGGGNQPARVSLVSIPSREELRQKNLFSVSDCKMYWQSNGEYLAVKVDRYTKTKKSTYTGFELFRVKERDIPIEVLELENKNDKIVAFAWEPKGHRFAIIHGDGPRPDISFYSMKGRVTKLTTLKGRQANALYWSPLGRFIILAGLKAYNGQLEFYNVDDLETMATAEHFMATDVDWDPTGRFCSTSVTSVHQMENGFNIWSFQGKLLYRLPRDRFFQFLWRPRPPTLLTPDDEAEIAKNLRKYSKKYEADDLARSLEGTERDTENRRKLVDEWKAWLAQWKAALEDESEERLMLRDGIPSDTEEDYEAEEVEVEEIINIEEEVVGYGFEQTD